MVKKPTSSTKPVGFVNIVLIILGTALAILAIDQFNQNHALLQENKSLELSIFTCQQIGSMHSKEAKDAYDKGYLASAWDMYKKTNRYAFTEAPDGSVTVWKKSDLPAAVPQTNIPVAKAVNPIPLSTPTTTTSVPLVSSNAEHRDNPVKRSPKTTHDQ